MKYTDFTDDIEKMRDFQKLSKDEFLQSYSYLTEEEYDLTADTVKLNNATLGTVWYGMPIEEIKEKMISLAKEINNIADMLAREWAVDKFRDDIGKYFDNESVSYVDDKIRNDYVNWDSNCGCSIINASIDFESIANYLIENNMEPSLHNALEALCDLGERTEYWGDVIDENYYMININLLVELMGMSDEYIGEDKFIEDFKKYKECK